MVAIIGKWPELCTTLLYVHSTQMRTLSSVPTQAVSVKLQNVEKFWGCGWLLRCREACRKNKSVS